MKRRLSVTDEKLLVFGISRQKESISDVCLEVKMIPEQQNEIIIALGKREEIWYGYS